jgi:hypothetical protein
MSDVVRYHAVYRRLDARPDYRAVGQPIRCNGINLATFHYRPWLQSVAPKARRHHLATPA